MEDNKEREAYMKIGSKKKKSDDNRPKDPKKVEAGRRLAQYRKEHPECEASRIEKQKETCRKRRSMKEWAWIIGNYPTQMVLPYGYEITGDIAGDVVLKQVVKAIEESDTRAAEFLMRLRGEDVVKIEQSDDEETTKMLKEQFEQLYMMKGVNNEPQQD